jgi:hypothetical protein
MPTIEVETINADVTIKAREIAAPGLPADSFAQIADIRSTARGRSHWRGEPSQFDFSDLALVGSEIRGEITSINS